MDGTVILRLLIPSCVCLLTTTVSATGWDAKQFEEEALQTNNVLFHNYNPNVRPPVPSLEVFIEVTLRQIRDLDLTKQELQTVLDLELEWVDQRLTWFPRRLFQIVANTSAVWVPDVIYSNIAAPSPDMFPSTVRVSHDGHVKWTRKQLVTTTCDTDLDRSSQMCSISVAFLTSFRDAQEDRYFSNMSAFVLPGNWNNHEWRLLSAEMILSGANDTKSTSFDVELTMESIHGGQGDTNRRGSRDQRNGGGNSGQSSSDGTSGDCADSSSNKDKNLHSDKSAAFSPGNASILLPVNLFCVVVALVTLYWREELRFSR